MRYFSRGWANGDLDEAGFDRAVAEYRARLDQIAPQLPTELVARRGLPHPPIAA